MVILNSVNKRLGQRVAHPEMLKAITAAKKKNDRNRASPFLGDCAIRHDRAMDDASFIMFRGRQVDPNSIFCNGHNNMSGRVIERGPTNGETRSEIKAAAIKAARGITSGWSREISVFPLTKLNIDVPRYNMTPAS